jgi:hypothetical protein
VHPLNYTAAVKKSEVCGKLLACPACAMASKPSCGQVLLDDSSVPKVHPLCYTAAVKKGQVCGMLLDSLTA